MPKKGRGFKLYGPAAGAFLFAQAGEPAQTDDERALRVATLVAVNMGKDADTSVAVRLIKLVAEKGLVAAAAECTAKRPG